MTQDPFYETDSQATYQAPPTPVKKNKTVIIIVVVAAVLLLCCCSLAAAAWFLGDPIMDMINDIMYDLNMNLGLLPVH